MFWVSQSSVGLAQHHFVFVLGVLMGRYRGCGVVVSHPLRMRRVPGSNPGDSIVFNTRFQNDDYAMWSKCPIQDLNLGCRGHNATS